VLCLFVAVLTPLLASSAVQGVDFSSRWVLQSPAAEPDAPRALVIEQPVTRLNVRGEPIPPAFLRITIRRERLAGVSSETRLIGVSGGIVGGIVRDSVARTAGERSTSTHQETRWDRERLVFTDGSYTGDSPRTGDWTERREVWSLTANGTLVIEISSEGSAEPQRTETLVYIRA
jgi:hypothetical protein